MDVLKWLAIAILVWIIETVCCAIAYRIHRGQKGLGIPIRELFERSMLVAVFCALVGMAGVACASGLDLGGQSSLIVYACFIPFGAQIINWLFGLDDWLAGLGIYFLRAIPAICLIVPILVIR